MILDDFNNLKRYSIPQIEKILNFISKNNCLLLPNEQIDIDGERLFVRVMEYIPKPANENKFETHRIYADLQYDVSGIELMQTAPTQSLTSLGAYNPKEGDYEFFELCRGLINQTPTDLVVRTGDFTVFYPGEAHRPSCLYKNFSEMIKKLVFKIKIN